MTEEAAWILAKEWVAAWNAHDLTAILSHYEEGIESWLHRLRRAC